MVVEKRKFSNSSTNIRFRTPKIDAGQGVRRHDAGSFSGFLMVPAALFRLMG
jgi:hypothetical protein